MIVRLYAWLPVCDAESVAVTVKLLVAAVVGVPEIAPVLDESVRTAGRVPALTDQLYGAVPPVAASAAE